MTPPAGNPLRTRGYTPAPPPEKDPTCPDCKGRGTDKYGFDCVRCGGEGTVDE